MGDTAPCNMLHAWEQGVRANRPHRSVRGEPWVIFRRAPTVSLVAISDDVNGRPIRASEWRRLNMTEDAYRRTTLWCWGDRPGRTVEHAAAAFRAAAGLSLCDRDHASAV